VIVHFLESIAGSAGFVFAPLLFVCGVYYHFRVWQDFTLMPAYPLFWKRFTKFTLIGFLGSFVSLVVLRTIELELR
jgi:hypothetical protein